MRKEPPPSAVPMLTVSAGVGGTLLAFWGAWYVGLRPFATMFLMLSAAAAPMWWMEWRRGGTRADSGPAQSARSGLSRRVVGGLIASAMIGASMQIQLWFGGEQAGIGTVALLLIPACALWVLWLRFTPQAPNSSVTWLADAASAIFHPERRTGAARQTALAWSVKAVFLPLMLAWFYSWLTTVQMAGGVGWLHWFTLAMASLYALDTLFGTIGYLSTHRAIDAHIRSTDATWLGWLSALVCYPPLSAVVLRQWLDYQDGLEWQDWLGGSFIAPLWAVAILALTAVYTWATVVFGPRFSNLTNRGIITAGPFRWTKHPAYISKNLSWWLIAVPFVSQQGAGAATLNCLALLGVNAIYWTRAKTEERHLMQDPVYREYAAWIASYGWWARCRRIWQGTSAQRA